MIQALTFAAYAITLDGKTVLPRARAAVAAGHVLLPVRALGDALGADVGYNGGAHTITVQRGARVVTISARGAVRVVNGRAYAPLRTVASAFGLGVAYDARTRTVALDGSASTAPVARVTPPPGAFAAPAPAATPAAPGAYAITETPPNGAQIHEAYPAMSVRFAGATAIDPRTLRVLLDGRDVTADASVVGDQVLLTPRTSLTPGNHTVAVTARDASTGFSLADTWSFGDSFVFTNAPPPTPFPIGAIWIDRWIVPGTNAFDVYMEGAPGITGYVGVDGVGGFFALRVNSATSYVAHVFVPNGVNQPFARIAARITLPNGQLQTIVLPQRFNIVTPPLTYATPVPPVPPRPTTTPLPRPVPSRRSVDVPTPTPTAMPTPARRPPQAATPTPTPPPRPAPTPTPTPPRPSPTPAPPRPSPTPVPTSSLAPSPKPVRVPVTGPAPVRPLIRRTPAPTPVPTPAPTPTPTPVPAPR